MNKVYVCLKVHDKYSSEYVNKLYSMIKRADPLYSEKLFCYTDNAAGLNDNIQPVLIKEVDRYDRWWFKIPLLVEPQIQHYEKKILFDLDVIIHGNLDFIDSISGNKLTVCKAYWKSSKLLEDKEELNTLYNSSVMVWKDASYVYNHFVKNEDYYMLRYKGIDRYLYHEQIEVDTLPAGIVYSYRKGADLSDKAPFVFRDNYDIAIFHQHPKQHDVATDFIVEKFWK